MRALVIILMCMIGSSAWAQLTCEDIKRTERTFTLTSCRNGKAKLFNTDTAITNRIKLAMFEPKQLKNMPDKIQEEVKRFKFSLKAEDTVIVYDWDIMHQAKIGYFGPAVGKIKIDCKDSTVTIYKYLLQKETTNYVPTKFKMFKIGKDNFIFMDKDHPYLNINYYFKQQNN
jgi:hypothetical protein